MDTKRYDFRKWHISLPGRQSPIQVVILLALAAIPLVLYYLGDGFFVDVLDGQEFLLGQAYHEILLLVFSCFVIIVAVIYRIRWGLATGIAGFLVILPHALLLPAYPDPLYRILSWLAINILLAIVAGGALNARDRQQDDLREIIKAQEQERQRISRELHDDTAQDLVDAAHAVDDIIELSPGLAADATDRLHTLRSDIDRILEKTRNIVHDLQPPIVDEVGLKSSLFGLCDDFEDLTGIEIDTVIEAPEESLNTEAKIAVFRIAQEALTNIRKHTSASRVSLEFIKQDNIVRLRISDNGTGFTLPGMGKLRAAGKAGLLGIQQRTALVHGTFHVDTSQNGTVISVEIPAVT